MPYMRRSPIHIGRPSWLAQDVTRKDMAVFPAKLDPSQFADASGILVQTTGVAAIGAVSIPVVALTDPILDVGITLSFGAVGSGKFAKTTAVAAAGDTAIAVEAIPTALASGDRAYYNPFGTKLIPSGTLVGRTYAERASNVLFGAAVDTDDEIYLTVFDILDAQNNSDCELLRHNQPIKENFLPDYAVIAANAPLLAKLRSYYQTLTGTV